MELIPGYDPIATAPKGYWFDVETAEMYCDFFPEVLKHVKGKKGGEPFVLEPWQQAKTGCLFGWKRPDGLRRYRTLFDYVPRKNGKTPWSAGVVLATLILDDEPGMEVYSGACDVEQASLCWQYAYGMLLSDEELTKRIKPYTTRRVFEYLEKFAYYTVLSGDKGTNKHGKNVHLGILDETHAHKSPELIDTIATGTAARTQPIIIHTTTADWLQESVCNELYDYACSVRDGIISDPHFLPVIYEAIPPSQEETGADELWWTHEDVWKIANPNYGVSVEPSYIREECQRAIEVPRLRNRFKRLHLNIRTGQDTAWFGLEAWDACYDPTLTAEDLHGERCFAGLDLATVSDLCALVLWFPVQRAVVPFFWLPQETVSKRTERAKVPYYQWAQDGSIMITPGNVVDYDAIRDFISGDEGIIHTYDITELAIDRWNSTQLQTQLMGDGLEVVPFGQGYASMSAPSKELERLITSKELRHMGHPVMRWMASHVATEEDPAGNLKPSKKHSSEKIDGIVSLIMALGRSMVDEGPEGPSVYEERGILVL